MLTGVRGLGHIVAGILYVLDWTSEFNPVSDRRRL